MFSDTHCHIFKEYFDIDEIMQKIEKKHLNIIINNAVDYNTALEVISYSKVYNKMYFAIGLHPQENSEDLTKIISLIEENLNNPKFLAIGEIGLDYYHSENDKSYQQEIFRQQLDLAEKYKKPVIIHSREATADTLKILKEYNVKGIIHCFNGSKEIAREYIKMGFILGIGGVVTFKNCNLIETIEAVGIENIVFETDSPYLTPYPFRKEKNDPTYIECVAKFLEEKLNIKKEKLYEISELNLSRLFDKK